MTNGTQTAPVVQHTDDDELIHVTCCDDNRGLCGSDVTTAAETDEEWNCVVCLDLADTPCRAECDW